MAHTFNGTLKRIYIDSNLPDVVVQQLYSDWKEWAVQGDNLGFSQAFRTFGGDPTVEGQSAPAYYFLENGWRIVVDGFDATFGYNLYTSEGENPIITLNGGTALLNNSDVGIVKTALDEALDYNGTVWVDFIDGDSGQEYPLGTSVAPVDNIADAVAIANSYGINHIMVIKGSGTANVYMPNFTVQGVNPQSTTIVLMGDLTNSEHIGNYRNTIFSGVTLTGISCGCGWTADNCTIKDAYQLAGIFKNCGLYGTIGLSSRIDPETGLPFPSVFYQCVSGIAGFDSPVLDMVTGLSTTTSFRAYSGGLSLEHADHPDDKATFEFVAGKMHIQPSCTEGEISVRGVVKVNDYSNGLVVDDSATVSKLVDLSNVSISTGDISVDVDEGLIASAVRVEMDANSTKLNQISSDVSSLDVTAITLGQTDILNAIASNSNKLDDIDSEVDVIHLQTTELLEAGNSLQNTVANIQTSQITEQDVWEYSTRELTTNVSSLDETDIHNALDSYANKADYKSSVSQQVILDAISALNNLSLSDLEASDVIAKQATLALVKSIVENMNDVSASDVRAVFNAADFKDKNTEAEIHLWLDSYTNKSAWKDGVTIADSEKLDIRDKVWEKIV